MKKTSLLNSLLSNTIAQMGHTQMLTIGDAGLPIPKEVQRIDLAVCKGIPSLTNVLDAALSELCVEKIILAKEIIQKNPKMMKEIEDRFKSIEIVYISHEEFKELTKLTNAIVRTGETTAYSNIILVSGVTF